MNQYHIYEAIGRGRYSAVYKGRKKKTIDYFAIKSVDKSQRSKVLHEVKILHSLDHPNILKFFSWYETSAHLWLVLEYCVGGDILTLLRQDGHLPENSIYDIAQDLVSALQFLHSKGIIYCDLKPSNILLDESGHAKLCDFGLARKLSDISSTPSLSQAKRGAPCYMAPELFHDGGVHSYASDLWALGCVLYECYVGKPPFLGREFTQLLKSILSDPTPPLPGSPSRPFVNLINSLLVKDPSERIQWSELCGHAFWRTSLNPISLPSQPAFINMTFLYSKPCFSEQNCETPLQNKTPCKSRGKDTQGSSRQDDASTSGSRGHETPIKGIASSRKVQTKGYSRVIVDKMKELSGATRGVNLLRLSKVARSNLLRENEKENYRRPLPNSSENNSEVKIENNDMELDFNENSEEDIVEEPDRPDSLPCTADDKLNQNQNPPKVEEDENINHSGTPVVVSTPLSDDSKTADPDLFPEHAEMTASPLSASPQLKAQRVKEGAGFGFNYESPQSSTDLSEAFWHPSDLSVRPVMPSRKVDKLLEAISLPFEILPASDFAKISKEQLDLLNNRIIGVLSGNTSIADKQNVLRYLELLSSNSDVANTLTNGPIMPVLVKMLRQSKASVLRVQLASIIGLLIRYSTFIGDALANSGILNSLTDGLRDRQEKVRRFSMAALGELLFYISTQNEQNRDNNHMESPSKDGRSSSGWQVSSSLISLVSATLRKGEDDATQLYALRTIENICSHEGHWATRFTSQDVISNLCHIFRAAGKQESTRLTAGSCLVRLVRFNPGSTQSVMEKLPFKDIATSLIKGSSREQQIDLNLLNMAMLGSHMFTSFGRYLLPLAEDKNLVPALVSLIEQGSEVLKGKALIFVALLCKHGKRWLLHFFCNARLLSAVDRLAKEKDKFVQQCLIAFIIAVASTIPTLLETINGDIQQIMSGKRHGHAAVLTTRTSPKTNLHLFPVVLHLLGSSSFKHRVATPRVLQQLANLGKLLESPFQGRDDFQITLLRVIESIAEEASVILESPNIFIREILPSLAVLYKDNKDGDARFLCLKIMFDVMLIFLNEPLENDTRTEDLRLISINHFLPLYPTLIDDEDPIPIYAQKLFLMLIDFKYIKVSDIRQLKTVSQCFEFLLGDLSSANANNVKLCLALASDPEMENKMLSQLKIVRRIGNLLEFAHTKEMEDILEPTLGLCRALLLRSVSNGKSAVYPEEPDLLSDGYFVDHQECIKDISDFGSNVGVFLELSRSCEANISNVASECVVLVLRAAPREGTTGFLTNLPKATMILESWCHGLSQLLARRILHALGYSCRQYLSHGMILSVSLPEILKLETIVSEIKSSNTTDLANTAWLVALELQRLSRCV